MKAVTLYQFWAAAVALKMKRNETRPRRIRYRGPLLIHAGKDRFAAEEIFAPLTASQRTICTAFTERGYPTANSLAYGALVAVVQVVDCVPVEAVRDHLDPLERLLGDYSDGRFAWVLRDARRLARPIPWRGQQVLFEVPDETLKGAELL